MTTKRDQFREWIANRINEYGFTETPPDEIADAAARIWEGWQPIETAPKDGSLFIAWVQQYLRGKGLPVLAGWYREEATGEYCWMDFHRAFRLPNEPKCWCSIPPIPTAEAALAKSKEENQ